MEYSQAQLTRHLKALTSCNRAVIRAAGEQSMLEEVCQIICHDTGYRMAWVGLALDDEEKTVRPVAWAGAEEGYLENSKIVWSDTVLGQGPTGTAVRTGKIVYVQDFGTDPQVAPWRDRALARGYRSSIALPLAGSQGRISGALTIYAAEPDAMVEEERALLEELAGNLAFGINSLRAQAKYRDLFEQAAEGIFLCDRSGRYTDVNAAGCRLLGYTREELVGLTIWDVAEFPRGYEFSLDQFLQGRVVRTPRTMVKKDGTRITVENTARLLPDGILQAIVHDLTELQEARATLQAAMDQSPAGIVIADAPDCRLRFVNDQGLRIRGGDRQSLPLGINFEQYLAGTEIFDLDGRPLAYSDVPLVQAVFHNEPCKREIIVRRPGFSDRVVSASAAPIRDALGKVTAGIVIFMDMTDLRRAEEERSRLQAQLYQAQKMESLGTFAGGLAHEMNNVLAAILTQATAALLTTPGDSPVFKSLERISRAADRGGKVVRSLLTFARKDQAEKVVVDLNSLIRDGLAGVAPGLLGSVRLDLSLDPDLRPVLGDPAALVQAVMNLCINSLDALAGTGTLAVHTRNWGTDKIEVEVKDTGPGMAKEVLARASEPFFTTKPVGKGTGLGLALVYNTVQAHHGQMEIRSQPGQGTVVTLTLPSCPLPGLSAGLPVESRAEPAGTTALKVLLVDDDELILGSLKEGLEALGHQVTTAPSGETAFQIVARGPEPDVVVLDLNMPGWGGAETLGRLRLLCPSLPVILATGRTDQFALDLVNRIPHVVLLSKPFPLADLARKLEESCILRR